MHEHANVQVFVHGKKEPIPTDIGIDPRPGRSNRSTRTTTRPGASRVVPIARVHARRLLRRVGRPFHAELPGCLLQRRGQPSPGVRGRRGGHRQPPGRPARRSDRHRGHVRHRRRAPGPDPVLVRLHHDHAPSGAALAKKRKRRPSGSRPPAGSRPKSTKTPPSSHTPERPSPPSAGPGASGGSWRSRSSSRSVGCSSSGRRGPGRSRPRRSRRLGPRGAATSSSRSSRTRRGPTSRRANRSTTPTGRRRPGPHDASPLPPDPQCTRSRSRRRERSTTSSTGT